MPLYEYECTRCKRHTEKIQKFSDAEITECPYCSGPLERVISAPAIAFKGGGWFKDGYGNAKPAASDSGSKSGAGPSPASSSASSTPPGGDSSGASTPASTTASAATSPSAPTAEKK